MPVKRRPPPQTGEILYTSGSTGRPKGVVLSHAGQLWALSVHVAATPMAGERSLIVAPLYHMNALFNVSVCLLNGIEVVLMPRFDAAAYLKAVARHRCTLLSGIPTMFALMARQRELLTRLDLSSVKAVTIGSAPLTEALVARVQEMFPQAAISNGYGTTEAGPSIFEDHPQGLPRPLLSLGYPLPDVEVRLAGGTGDAGVLQVRSPAMFTEYLNLPGVTGAKLHDGWYDTGDVMRRDRSGFYYFTGRADDMFVCGGENVYPGEIEKMLERHPAVLQAAVVAVPDEIKGEIPIAFVVLKERGVSPEELKRFALESGPAYSHPRAFVVVDELPVATTHKLDKRPLQAQALAAAKALKR
jgi:acyl-CoA synthetase (AMP-forming)/AMP-acid ligase II